MPGEHWDPLAPARTAASVRSDWHPDRLPTTSAHKKRRTATKGLEPTGTNSHSRGHSTQRHPSHGSRGNRARTASFPTEWCCTSSGSRPKTSEICPSGWSVRSLASALRSIQSRKCSRAQCRCPSWHSQLNLCWPRTGSRPRCCSM